ncbi:MlaD family protein [Pseudonocardia acaciae]|uniref:MlaD family protein n=1 Tax=Pseudonocardia acaciae TaxID=551276 RepID=UPI0009FF7467|nr:MlaD family protein [Pseudonocardia acaciae]
MNSRPRPSPTTRRLVPAMVAVLVLAAIVGGYAVSQLGAGQRLTIVLVNAIGIQDGTPVQLRGFAVGKVTEVTARGNRAVVSFEVDKLPEPLRAGTTATVEWRSLLGERYLQLQPGPPGNAVLPDRAMIDTGSEHVVVEDLLEALDAPTRAHLSSMLKQLDTTLDGSQPDFNKTLQASGPTVQALGAVLNGIGSDGEAIKTLLANLHKVTEVVAARKGQVSSTVLDLNRMTGAAAVHQRELSEGLAALPDTLDSAKKALDKVPPAADATIPLLEDLAPAAHRLPSVARNLNAVLCDLRPSLKLLKPILEDLARLLGTTPEFLDVATDTLPQLRTALERSAPAVAFLRPYTPEIAGFAANWGNMSSGYDSNGNYISTLIVTPGLMSVDNNPGVLPPGARVQTQILPGELVGQPWKDANGGGHR